MNQKIIKSFQAFKESHPEDSDRLNMARAIMKNSTSSLADALKKAQELLIAVGYTD